MNAQGSDPGHRQGLFVTQPQYPYPHHYSPQYPTAPTGPPLILGSLPPQHHMGPPHLGPGPMQSHYSNSNTLPYGATMGTSRAPTPLPRSLSAVPPGMTDSRRSFQQVMGHPREYFVDVT